MVKREGRFGCFSGEFVCSEVFFGKRTLNRLSNYNPKI